MVFLFEKMQGVSRPTLSVKGTDNFIFMPNAFNFHRVAYDEVKLVKGLTYQISVDAEDYSNKQNSEVLISMFNKEA